MPMLAFKTKIKHGISEENLSIAFNCEYGENRRLQLKNYNPNYFDCGDIRIKIEDAIKKFDDNLLNKYEEKNGKIYFLALLNYFVDEIPSIYSIKYESDSSESIYYADEVKSNNNLN